MKSFFLFSGKLTAKITTFDIDKLDHFAVKKY